MRHLFLIRHAKSSWDNPGLRDFNRPLNDRGLRDAPKMAELLVASGIRPDLLVSSPAKRALTTAQFFAQALGIPEETIVRAPDMYEASPTDVLRIVSSLPDTASTVLLFGHNPTFTELANRFASAPLDNVPTCGIVHVESTAGSWGEFDEGNARVRNYMFPKAVL